MAEHAEGAARPDPFRRDLYAGRVVLVTGAGSGIGRETACLFARLGARILLCGRQREPLETTAQSIRDAGGEAQVHPMTIRDPEMADGAIAAAWESFGHLDALINIAGGQYGQAAIDFTAKGWNAVIETNLNGTWYMMQAAARRWRDQGRGGAIVNVVLDIPRGIPGMAHSVAARAGVVYLSKTVAVEWAPLDIRVNCVAPGLIESEGIRHYPEPVRRRLGRDTNPMRRMGHVADIAAACAYVAGPAASFMTGEVITIDGGQQLWGDVWGIEKPDYFRYED